MPPIFGYFVIQAVAQSISQVFAGRNANKIRESQERQATENREFQLKLQEHAIASQKEQAFVNHQYRQEESAEAHSRKLDEMVFQRQLNIWPLYNSPDEIRRCVKDADGFSTLTVLVAPLVTGQNKAIGAISPELIEKQQAVDLKLRSFLDENYDRSSDRPVYYIDEAWRNDSRIFGESAILSLFGAMQDLSTLVLQPCAVGKEINEIRFWFWDLGMPRPNYGSFRLPVVKDDTGNSTSQSAISLSKAYEFLVATVADWRLLARSGGRLLPHFPGIYETWKIESANLDDAFAQNALDSAISGYVKVIEGITHSNPNEALQICVAMKSKFEELKLKAAVDKMHDCIIRLAPIAPTAKLDNIKDYVQRFGK